MMRNKLFSFAFISLAPAAPAGADSLVTTHTLRAQTVLTANDFTLVDAEIPGALTDPQAVIGLETKVTLYAGRPLTAANVGVAALIERNQTVALIFRAGGLSILTEGRALARGGPGDVIKIMNLSSRATVLGTVGFDGSVTVNSAGEG
jgi:flagellar basal body P-ring formation protein FlgA